MSHPLAPYANLLPLQQDTTTYTKISEINTQTLTHNNQRYTVVNSQLLTQLTSTALREINLYLRTEHLQQVAAILQDPEASDNDRFVALELLKNATIASEGLFPMCQDTGTVIVMGKKGRFILTEHPEHIDDATAITEGVKQAYQNNYFRYSQLAPLTMYKEKNTGSNLPAQIEIYQEGDHDYRFLFVAKGGGSANKSFLFQETAGLLKPEKLIPFLIQKMSTIGTTACPPYHLAIVIGGTSAEFNLKTVKLASTKYLDHLPTQGSEFGHAFRDLELEQILLNESRKIGIGAQFGGKYYCHDIRVIRLPRHGASLPVGIGVSCAADRQIKAKINAEGVFIEQLEKNPAQFLPTPTTTNRTQEITLNTNLGIEHTLNTLRQLKTTTRVLITGSIIVARDLAHSRIVDNLKKGIAIPDYFKNYPIYYAGPAKTPEGFASGSFGPTTASRMDQYLETLMQQGASLVTLAKGNRTESARKACETHSGIYLGTIGGTGASIGRDIITKVERIDFEDLGMEAVWKIDVVNFPCFVIIDSKGNDFFSTYQLSKD